MNDMNEFPQYAIYNGTNESIFKKGDVIQFYSYNLLDEMVYNCYTTFASRKVYKPTAYQKSGYATYASLNCVLRKVVHISELLPYE